VVPLEPEDNLGKVTYRTLFMQLEEVSSEGLSVINSKHGCYKAILCSRNVDIDSRSAEVANNLCGQ
jgi:hypothetical protein